MGAFKATILIACGLFAIINCYNIPSSLRFRSRIRPLFMSTEIDDDIDESDGKKRLYIININ